MVCLNLNFKSPSPLWSIFIVISIIVSTKWINKNIYWISSFECWYCYAELVFWIERNVRFFSQEHFFSLVLNRYWWTFWVQVWNTLHLDKCKNNVPVSVKQNNRQPRSDLSQFSQNLALWCGLEFLIAVENEDNLFSNLHVFPYTDYVSVRWRETEPYGKCFTWVWQKCPEPHTDVHLGVYCF